MENFVQILLLACDKIYLEAIQCQPAITTIAMPMLMLLFESVSKPNE